MTSSLLQLSAIQLSDLAVRLRQGSLRLQAQPFDLDQHAPRELQAGLASELRQLRAVGMTELHVAHWLEVLAQQRIVVEEERASSSLVWTGPTPTTSSARDTAVVVRDLFSTAATSVLLATFAVYEGARFFAPLAAAMAERPSLKVELYLNISAQSHGDGAAVLAHFSAEFERRHWPWPARPAIYYDPRSLIPGSRSCLHAKCIVADESRALITSANFTESASERNIEAGTLTTDRSVIAALIAQFRQLVRSNDLKRLPGW